MTPKRITIHEDADVSQTPAKLGKRMDGERPQTCVIATHQLVGKASRLVQLEHQGEGAPVRDRRPSNGSGHG